MSAVAGRYAKSLISLAQEQNALDAVHDDMLAFSKVCEESRDFKVLLNNPIVNHAKKLEILKAIFEKKVNGLTMAIFNIITRKNRESIMYDISKEFHNQYNAIKGVGKAKVVTSTTLDKSQLVTFEQLVEKAINKKVELDAQVDEDLIGGFVLTVEDKQIDASVKSQINKLNNIFKDNPYISKI